MCLVCHILDICLIPAPKSSPGVEICAPAKSGILATLGALPLPPKFGQTF